ncbi:hypothetical protein [Sinanaerobacter sp. ZZT-01]|nr:hypothetical protein [Sinanaerobacter sp. ZZT-01]WRR93752.1 hypothetical protein U5921_01105 [Sinanaerobacter sp. ZZT-01]
MVVRLVDLQELLKANMLEEVLQRTFEMIGIKEMKLRAGIKI